MNNAAYQILRWLRDAAREADKGKDQARPRFRVGKTRRDHASGSHARRLSNRMERADWQNNHKHEEGLRDFPWHTCNGKRGRVWLAAITKPAR